VSVYLVERVNIPAKGRRCCSIWLERSSLEWALKTREAFAGSGLDLVVMDFANDEWVVVA
jgi:hypothetical protein